MALPRKFALRASGTFRTGAQASRTGAQAFSLALSAKRERSNQDGCAPVDFQLPAITVQISQGEAEEAEPYACIKSIVCPSRSYVAPVTRQDRLLR